MVYKSSIDMMTAVRKKFPEAKCVPVCMGDLVYSIYKDNTYSVQIAKVLYEPSNTGMFNYDYNLQYL